MTSGRPRRLLLALVGLALVSTACDATGPGKSAEPLPIEAGVCVKNETKDQGHPVPDLTTIVDCRTPHAYEVYDILDVPADALTGTTRQERIDNRDDLALPSGLADDSAQRQAFEEFSELACATSLQQVTGYDVLTLRDASAEDARIVPALRGISAPWYSVMPEDEWLDGRRQVVCSARLEEPDYTKPGSNPVHPRASDKRMLITRVSNPSLPVGFRQCRAYDKKREKVLASSCAVPHVDEALFYFEASGVFDKSFISSIRKKPTPKKFDRLDKVCNDALTQILGPGYHPDTMRGFGSVARRWTDTSTTARCSVGPVDFRTKDLAPGSLVGGGTSS
jgi:hypothetical protein